MLSFLYLNLQECIKGKSLLTDLLSVLVNRKFYSVGNFSPHLWSPKCLLQRKIKLWWSPKKSKALSTKFKNNSSIKFISKAVGKSAFDLFPLDISKEHKILSNKLSGIQLGVIKFSNHFFLATFILSSTINAQLTHD